jgi:hypothetical protein
MVKKTNDMWVLRAHQQNHLKDHSKLLGGVYFCILSSIRVPVLILYDNCRKRKGHS